jgi:hypothetical protein
MKIDPKHAAIKRNDTITSYDHLKDPLQTCIESENTRIYNGRRQIREGACFKPAGGRCRAWRIDSSLAGETLKAVGHAMHDPY